jgi:drug/metabolite transporter (DMT)-like permease
MESTPSKGALCAVAAAALFGVSAPLAKLLVATISPLLLAGLLYLGGGLGLAAVGLATRGKVFRGEAKLRKSDVGYLLAIMVLGGVVGPVLMLFGLRAVSGVAGSLLLNLETVFTILLAVYWFREHIGARGIIATTLVVAGAVMLGIGPGGLRAPWTGVLAIAGACACWAVDNNLTQRLSLRNPIAVVRIKALSAGACTLGIALAAGEVLPSFKVLILALSVGVVCYGISIALDMYALRILGAAREAAYFATAPFLGALAAIPILGERPGLPHLLSAVLMGAGAFLLIRERHGHLHRHEALEHDHAHVHDQHHRHQHEGSVPLTEPHSHPHRHVTLVHDHPHVSDLHHRHRH